MGTTQSVQVIEGSEDEDEEAEEEREEVGLNHIGRSGQTEPGNPLVKKILQQEPEMLPCHASASPLSPQLSSLGTPRLGPSIKVWDPYNVMAPPPPLPPPLVFSKSFMSSSGFDEDQGVTEVFLISHGECELNLRPELIGGRCPEVVLTPNGKRQARALAVFLNSQGVRFTAVYSSPLSRAREMAVSICKEVNFLEEQIQNVDALSEMSQGHWEGCHHSEIYTPELIGFIDASQPDFTAPSGESLRLVEYRMIHFLNSSIQGLSEKLRADLSIQHQNENQVFAYHSFHALTNSIHERDGHSLHQPHWDLLPRHRQGLWRKKSGKSRLQYVTTTGDEIEDELSPPDTSHQSTVQNSSFRSFTALGSCIGVFSHSVPIKCLLTGLFGCSPVMSHRICIDDSSVTVLQHSWKTGWQIKRMNDTSHLRLL